MGLHTYAILYNCKLYWSSIGLKFRFGFSQSHNNDRRSWFHKKNCSLFFTSSIFLSLIIYFHLSLLRVRSIFLSLLRVHSRPALPVHSLPLFVVRRYSLQQRVALSVSPVKQFSPADGQIFAVSAFRQRVRLGKKEEKEGKNEGKTYGRWLENCWQPSRSLRGKSRRYYDARSSLFLAVPRKSESATDEIIIRKLTEPS